MQAAPPGVVAGKENLLRYHREVIAEPDEGNLRTTLAQADNRKLRRRSLPLIIEAHSLHSSKSFLWVA